MQEFEYNDNLINDSNATTANLEEIKKARLQELVSLDEELAKINSDYAQLLQSYQDQVDEALKKLDKDLEEYDSHHSSEIEEKKVMNNRNLVLRLKKGQIDKVVKEAKDNIANSEKECFEKIHNNENELKRLEKEFNTFIYENERKTKSDVKRISETILAPKIKDDGEEIDLISATDEDYRQKYLKEEAKINEMRIEGIKNIATLQHAYYDVKKEKEIDFVNSRIALKKEIELIKNKEDEDVANLQHIVREESNRLRDEEYFTNHNAMINLFGVNYKNSLIKIKMKKDAYTNIESIYQKMDILNEEYFACLDKRLELINNSQVELLNSYFAMYESGKDNIDSNNLDSINDYINKVNEFINGISTNLDFNDFKLVDGFDYQISYDSISNQYVTSQYDIFVKKTSETTDSKNLKDLVKGLLEKVDKEINSIKERILKGISNYAIEGKNYISLLKSDAIATVNNNALGHQEWMLTKDDELKEEQAKAKAEYNESINNLENEKQDYASTYSKNYISEVNEFKQNMKLIKSQPKKINDKYDKMLKDELSRIEEDYLSNTNSVNIKEKERLQMCKKTNNK